MNLKMIRHGFQEMTAQDGPETTSQDILGILNPDDLATKPLVINHLEGHPREVLVTSLLTGRGLKVRRDTLEHRRQR